MLCIVLLSLAACSRLLRLKLKDGFYVTNNNGTLRLEPSTPFNLPNQRVVIHKRILYFFRDGTYHTLAMAQGSTDIKLVVYNIMGERDIGFLRNSMMDPYRRKINPFSYLSQAKKSEPRSLPEALPQEPLQTPERPKRPERIKKTPEREEKPLPKPVLEQKRPVESPPSSAEPVASGEAKRDAAPARHRQRESHLIESDSKMEDHEFGYVVKNVMVSEIDRDHFSLVAQGNSCVTYYKDEFVFMPCTSATEQIFRLESSENALKKSRDESSLLDDDDALGKTSHLEDVLKKPEHMQPGKGMVHQDPHPAPGKAEPADKRVWPAAGRARAPEQRTDSVRRPDLDDNFIDRFREIITNKDLNDFI